MEKEKIMCADCQTVSVKIHKLSTRCYSCHMKHKRKSLSFKKNHKLHKWRKGEKEFIKLVNLLDSSQRMCEFCLKTERDGVKLTIDHIKPLSKGGTHEILNLQLLCLECNNKKADKITCV